MHLVGLSSVLRLLKILQSGTAIYLMASVRNISDIPMYRVFTKKMARFQKFIKRLHSATGRYSPPFNRNVRELLNRVLQQRWIGRAANGDNHIHVLYGPNSTIVWMCVV
jgi:hypothetical protein